MDRTSLIDQSHLLMLDDGTKAISFNTVRSRRDDQVGLFLSVGINVMLYFSTQSACLPDPDTSLIINVPFYFSSNIIISVLSDAGEDVGRQLPVNIFFFSLPAILCCHACFYDRKKQPHCPQQKMEVSPRCNKEKLQ